MRNGPQEKANLIGVFKCFQCDSIIEASEDEAYDTHGVYQGYFLYFKCPVCGSKPGVEIKEFRKRTYEKL